MSAPSIVSASKVFAVCRAISNPRRNQHKNADDIGWKNCFDTHPRDLGSRGSHSLMIVSERCRSFPSEIRDDGRLSLGDAMTGLSNETIAGNGAEIAGRYFLKKRASFFSGAHRRLVGIEGNRISLLD